MKQRLVITAVATIAFGGLVMGQMTDQPIKSDKDSSTWKSDKDSTAWTQTKSGATTQMSPQGFIEAAAQANNLDLQVADRAIEHATDDQVKQLAKSLKDQHAQSKQILMAIADRKNLKFNEDLKPEQKQMLDQLKDKPKDQFNQAFLQQQMHSYQDCVNKYNQIASSLDDVELKNFAQTQSKKLSESMTRMQSVASAVGVDVSSQAQPAGAKMPGQDQPAQPQLPQQPAQPQQDQPAQPMPQPDQQPGDKPIDKQ